MKPSTFTLKYNLPTFFLDQNKVMNSTPKESTMGPTIDAVPVKVNSDPYVHIVSYCEQMFDNAIPKSLTPFSFSNHKIFSNYPMTSTH